MGWFHKLRKGIRAKLRSVSGLSFAELLVTTLILLLVTEIVADGLPAVIRLYRQTVDIANAEAYLSTTMIALRSKLSLSNEVGEATVEGQRRKVYLDPETGYYIITKDEKYENGEDKGIWITYLQADMETRTLTHPPDPENPKMTLPLIPRVKNDTSTLIADYDGEIEYGNGSFTITNLRVKKQGSNETLAEVKGDIIIRTLNP